MEVKKFLEMLEDFEGRMSVYYQCLANILERQGDLASAAFYQQLSREEEGHREAVAEVKRLTHLYLDTGSMGLSLVEDRVQQAMETVVKNIMNAPPGDLAEMLVRSYQLEKFALESHGEALLYPLPPLGSLLGDLKNWDRKHRQTILRFAAERGFVLDPAETPEPPPSPER